MSNNEMYCDNEEIYNGPFLEFGVSLPICITLQLAVLFHTIYQEYKNRNVENFVTYFRLRMLFILLQCIGLSYLICDLFGVLIDPFTLILRHNIGCDIVAYAPKFIPMLYYFIYLYQILLRLQRSFKDSFLELSKITTYTLTAFICVPIISAPFLFFFVLNSDTKTCQKLWRPSDFPSFYDDNTHIFSWCNMELSFGSFVGLLSGILWVAFLNILFGVIFAVKLKKLLSTQQDNIAVAFQLKTLIIKNSICTIFGAISTLLSYVLNLFFFEYFEFGVSFIYLDLFINAAVIGLMFRHNKTYYTTICKCCIILCFKCDKTKNKVNEMELEIYLKKQISLKKRIKSTSPTNQNTPASSVIIVTTPSISTNINTHSMQIETPSTVEIVFRDDHDRIDDEVP